MRKTIFTILALSGLLSQGFLHAQEDGEDYVKFGGAVRYNILNTAYENPTTTLNTAATWDTWRLNVDARTAGVDLSFEYRFYPTFGTHFIHHGYLGYGLNDDTYMKLGVFQVPFGISKFASHSWWFQIPYYVGLEDDYDMGIGFTLNQTGNVVFDVAYFRQAEPEGPVFGGVTTFGNAGAGRYSYDITPDANRSIRELDQFNLRARWSLSEAVELGGSLQFGGIYNSELDEREMSNAFAAHVVANEGPWNFKGEIISYDYSAKNDASNDLLVVPMGAYGSTYDVAAKGMIYVAGLAYSMDVDWGPISNIQPYIDYSVVDKAEDSFASTQHLVPGFLLTAGSIYTYVDYAVGKNQPWLTDSFGQGLGAGDEDASWNKRFNINIGYYF